MSDQSSPAIRFSSATREEALGRVDGFAHSMGSVYARSRNDDLGPEDRHNVSCLSPYVRHRLVLEEELVARALADHGPQRAEKFIQEVVWRTYWKGWLEQRPSVWADYTVSRSAVWDNVIQNKPLLAHYDKAIQGGTGIACFDFWANELVATNYLHNHARMWFASIWIFTLKLPWELGADFFLRHLIDGDAASNTLSWRWVGGLHTAGKTYLARADNIEQCTGGRFSPKPGDLADVALPLGEVDHPARTPIPHLLPVEKGLKTGLLITADDCTPENILDGLDVASVAALPLADTRSELDTARAVTEFEHAALTDALSRNRGEMLKQPADVLDWAKRNGLQQIVSPAIPVGWSRDAMASVIAELNDEGIVWREIRRSWDDAIWPHATAGFFKVKKQIPRVLEDFFDVKS
ncbi:FAD-binding domain-containing protein [Pseudahrensia aquimaris]|uniref:FAD-binding domain-containing protein n=1 Tax=Pseudahrensia aquimaris TaxID=744461 RepID=A0ABW3FAY6_9HYPH